MSSVYKTELIYKKFNIFCLTFWARISSNTIIYLNFLVHIKITQLYGKQNTVSTLV